MFTLQDNINERYDLVILDRDGVINLAPEEGERYILSPEDLHIDPLVIRFIVGLQKKGVLTCVATNQQCVGKGLITTGQLSEIHGVINNSILVLGGKPLEFFSCTHLIKEDCLCRKPKPGLLIEALKFFSVSPSKTLFIGDQMSDKIAADLANLEFVFADRIDFN